FIQAEDGIRDGHVTGVQTCALPILATIIRLSLSNVPTKNASYVIRKDHIEITTAGRIVEEKVLRVYPVGELVIPINSGGGMGGRSEERRVGKGCRARAAREPERREF